MVRTVDVAKPAKLAGGNGPSRKREIEKGGNAVTADEVCVCGGGVGA